MGDGLSVHRLQVGIIGTNCYLVMDDISRDGYVVDPGADGKRIVREIDSLGMQTKGVLLTHGHWDHVGAAAKVSRLAGTAVYINRLDAGVLGEGKGVASVRLGGIITPKPGEIEFIGEGSRLPLGEGEMEVLCTPGHTPGSVSFLLDGLLFCGDLIFEGSVGRTDLRGSSPQALMESIRDKVLPLPDETRIFPGHGQVTLLGVEKARNPFLAGL